MSEFDKRRARSDELEPCPFCGSTNIANVSAGFAGPTNLWHAGDEFFAVNCQDCGASVPNRYKNSLVVAAWNRRAVQPYFTGARCAPQLLGSTMTAIPIPCEATYARLISVLKRAQTSEVLNIKEPSQVFRLDESLVLGLVRLRQEVFDRNTYGKITGFVFGADWLNPLMADDGFVALCEVEGTESDLVGKALAGEWAQILGVPVYADRALKPYHTALTLPANRLVFLTENQAFHFDVDPSVLTARSLKE